MHVPSVLVAALTAMSSGARAAPQGPPPDAVFGHEDGMYPVCPENYSTYCCFTVVPYTTHCTQKTGCKNEPGWSCIAGAGKVDSIRTCLEEKPDLSAYCKRPGYEYFPSILQWTGGSFSPMLEPSDYRHYIRPGMKEPWVPGQDEIVWEGGETKEADESDSVEDSTQELEGSELR
jgi:hypothetical protein